MKRLFLSLLLGLSFVTSFAQQHDHEKYLQIKSMETGPWDFSPGFYYWTSHNDYSGAKFHFNWFNSSIKFHERLSSVKRVLPVRAEAAATQLLKLQQLKETEKDFKNLYKQEQLGQIERNVDLAYNSYKDDFERMNGQCLEGFAYILKESNNKLLPNVAQLTRELNLINERVAYFHKTGIGHELENGKREKGYISAKRDLQKLVAKTRRLALRANLLY